MDGRELRRPDALLHHAAKPVARRALGDPGAFDLGVKIEEVPYALSVDSRDLLADLAQPTAALVVVKVNLCCSLAVDTQVVAGWQQKLSLLVRCHRDAASEQELRASLAHAYRPMRIACSWSVTLNGLLVVPMDSRRMSASSRPA